MDAEASVSVEAVERLLAHMRRAPFSAMTVAEVAVFLMRSSPSAEPDSTPERRSPATSISSGLSFIGSGSPLMGFEDDEEELAEHLRRTQLFGDVQEPKSQVNADFLSENFESINFSLGSGEKKDRRRFGVKQRVGRTPHKFKAGGSPAQPQTPLPSAFAFAHQHTTESAEKSNRMSMDPEPQPQPQSEHASGAGASEGGATEGFFVLGEIKFGVNFEKKSSPAKKKVPGKKKAAPAWSMAPSEEPPCTPSQPAQPPAPLPLPARSRASAANTDKDSALEAIANKLRKEGKEQYNSEEYVKALESFTRVLEMCPSTWALYVTVLANRSATLMMLDRFEEVCQDCDQCIALDNLSIKILCRKGRALLKLGRFREAEASFSRVLETPKHGFGSADPEVVKADARSGLKLVISVQELVGKLRAVDVGGDYERSQALAEEILEISPYFHECILVKANALTSQRLFKESRLFIEERVCSMHHTLVAGLAHERAFKTTPDRSAMEWREDANGRVVANFFIIGTSKCIP